MDLRFSSLVSLLGSGLLLIPGAAIISSAAIIPTAAIAQPASPAPDRHFDPRPDIISVTFLKDAPIFQSSSPAQSPSPTPSSSAQSSSTQSSSPQSTSSTQSTTTPQTQTSSGKPEDPHAQAQRELKQQESQRMLGIVPAFNEVIGGHAAPLTPAQKFDLFFHSAFDPYQFGIVALDAGIEQWEDQYPEYHFGIAGYSRRYAAAFGDNFDGNFWGNAVLPSVLHQDPRYYRLGHGKVVHRILYAASTTVICKGDNGRWQPNISNVAGNLIGGGFSNFYYPAADRGVGLTFQRGLTVTATGGLGALAEEFYPDVASYFSRRHARKDATKANAKAGAASSAPWHSAPQHRPPQP